MDVLHCLQGLQSGWISMMSLQSSLLGFAVFKLPIPKFLSPSSRPFTAQENVVVQTTAVATGTLPLAAGLVGIIPALEQLDLTLDGVGPMKLSFWQLIGWSIGICFFGVFLAVPLRKQVIVKEKLVFPSGTATAQLIALLHKIPPPKVPVPRAAQLASSRSSGYQPLPSSADQTGVRSSSLDVDQLHVAHEANPSSGTGEDPDEKEEMGSAGWYVLGSCFAASGFVTVSDMSLSHMTKRISLIQFGCNLAPEFLVSSRIRNSRFRRVWNLLQHQSSVNVVVVVRPQ